MNFSEKEIEAKFYINHPKLLAEKLIGAGAELISDRIHEINLRFDTPDGLLTRERRVLRLRQDEHAILTYKNPAQPGYSVSVRQEIEVEVSDFTKTRHILEALGYVLHISYEKYRTTYRMANVEVTLDEMPYGNFSEIEGPDPETVEKTAHTLGLKWEARCNESYLVLFHQVRRKLKLKARNLFFDELKDILITNVDLGLIVADELA